MISYGRVAYYSTIPNRVRNNSFGDSGANIPYEDPRPADWLVGVVPAPPPPVRSTEPQPQNQGYIVPKWIPNSTKSCEYFQGQLGQYKYNDSCPLTSPDLRRNASTWRFLNFISNNQHLPLFKDITGHLPKRLKSRHPI